MNERIYAWINQGLIKPNNQQQALEVAGERARRTDWLQFVRQLLVLMGLLSLTFGVVFFFAYNWNDMSRMVKFALVEAALLGVFLLYLFKTNSAWVAQSLLLIATLLVGSLLALFGQTYQTGADPWQLFATWSVLILPLVLFSRSEVMWLVLTALLNLSLSLYLQVNGSIFRILIFGYQQMWLFLTVNLALLFVVEWLTVATSAWTGKFRITHRWAAQVIGLSVLFILAIIGMEAIWGNKQEGLNFMVYLLLMAGGFAYYRFIQKDLLLLTAWAIGVMTFVLALLANTIFKNFDAGGLLLMALSLIGMSAWTVKWIKGLHQAFNQELSHE